VAHLGINFSVAPFDEFAVMVNNTQLALSGHPLEVLVIILCV
jgi:hypothetical protein